MYRPDNEHREEQILTHTHTYAIYTKTSLKKISISTEIYSIIIMKYFYCITAKSCIFVQRLRLWLVFSNNFSYVHMCLGQIVPSFWDFMGKMH